MTEPRTAAGRALLDLADGWEESARIVGERAMFGDPATAIATVNTLRECASQLRAAEAEAAELAGGLEAEAWAERHRFDTCLGPCHTAAAYRQSVVIPAGQDETPRTEGHSS